MENSLKQRISYHIRETRETLGISQERLALMSGISRKYMIRIENGKANFTVDVLEKLADSLEISVSELAREDFSAEEATASAARPHEQATPNWQVDEVVIEDGSRLREKSRRGEQ